MDYEFAPFWSNEEATEMMYVDQSLIVRQKDRLRKGGTRNRNKCRNN